MKIVLHESAWGEYLWFQAEDRTTLKRINRLVRDITRGESSEAIGNPELLRGRLSGWSSRRVTQEHRLVYRVDIAADVVEIIACKGHYGDK